MKKFLVYQYSQAANSHIEHVQYTSMLYNTFMKDFLVSNLNIDALILCMTVVKILWEQYGFGERLAVNSTSNRFFESLIFVLNSFLPFIYVPLLTVRQSYFHANKK